MEKAFLEEVLEENDVVPGNGWCCFERIEFLGVATNFFGDCKGEFFK